MLPAQGDRMVLKLFDGLDEMAAGARAGIGPRLVAMAGGGLLALAFLPWPVCAAWIAVTGGVDIVSWFPTAEQERGGAVSWRARLAHLACLVGGVAGWVLLGVLFWRTGSAGGALCGVVVWLSVMGFAQ